MQRIARYEASNDSPYSRMSSVSKHTATPNHYFLLVSLNEKAVPTMRVIRSPTFHNKSKRCKCLRTTLLVCAVLTTPPNVVCSIHHHRDQLLTSGALLRIYWENCVPGPHSLAHSKRPPLLLSSAFADRSAPGSLLLPFCSFSGQSVPFTSVPFLWFGLYCWNNATGIIVHNLTYL